MNVKESGIIPSIITGVIVGAAVVLFDRTTGQGDNTVAALAELKTQVAHLTEQLKEFKGLPYVRREEFTDLSDRVAGLNRRVDQIERPNDRQSGRR